MLDAFLYVVLVAAVVAAVLISGRALLYATALLIPATQAMPQVLPPVGTPTNLIVLGLFVAAIRGSGATSTIRDPLPLRRSLALMSLALLVGIGIRGLGGLQGVSYLMPLTEVVRNSLYWLTPFGVYWATYRLVQDEQTAWRIIRLCQVSMAAECGITFVESIRGFARATAHLAEPNAAGAYFSSAAALFFTCMLWESTWRRWIYGVLWLLGINAVFNSLSRGGMLSCALACLFAAVIFYAIAPGRRLFKIGFVAALAFAILNVAIFVPEKVHDRILVTFRGKPPSNMDTENLDVSSEERLEYWNIAWMLSKEQPWGRGAFTFPQYCQAYSVRGEAKQAHNIYLEVLVELGAQGLVAMIALVIAVFVRLAKAFRDSQDPRLKVISLSLMAWWMSHLVAHVFGNPFFLLQLIGQFFLMTAAVFRLESLARMEGRESSTRRPIREARTIPLRA